METPDWILEMCARAVFEYEEILENTASGLRGDLEPEYIQGKWDSYEEKDKRPLLQFAWDVLVNEYTAETCWSNFDKTNIQPKELSSWEKQIQEEVKIIQDVAATLRSVGMRGLRFGEERFDDDNE
jgi:hypothetical protein